MLALAGDDAEATFVVADSPKMMLVWHVPMALRRPPSSWVALTVPTSLGASAETGKPR